MAINITTTKKIAKFYRIMVYSQAGLGKTTAIKTAPNPIIISAERGLLPLKDVSIPVIEVSNKTEIEEAKEFVASDSVEMKDIEMVAVDSWSEIAETVLSEEFIRPNSNAKKRHGQEVYGELGRWGKDFLAFFRDVVGKKRHVYMTAKMQRFEDEYSNLTTWNPEAPGATLTRNAPHYFDYVFPMRIGELKDKRQYRYWQTQPDIQYYAKSRGGLALQEEPNLTKLFNKLKE